MNCSSNSLVALGYALVPAISLKELPRVRADFIDCVRSLPEFQDTAQSFVVGGFGAISTPSSQHHPFVRHLRARLHVIVVPLFLAAREELHEPALQMEQLVDRVMLRAVGVSASADSVHRDECVYTCPGDHIFGGWLNLDSEPQVFSCDPGSHLIGVNSGGGFAKIKDRCEIEAYKARRQRVLVPPGHLLVFFENILHDVVAKKTTVLGGSARLFAGWRLTHAHTPLIPATEQMLQQQQLVPLKSGQVPRMYPKLYWVNHAAKLAAWTAAHLRPEYTVDRVVLSGKRKGDTIRVPLEHVRAVKRAYASYAPHELALHTPQHF